MRIFIKVWFLQIKIAIYALNSVKTAKKPNTSWLHYSYFIKKKQRSIILKPAWVSVSNFSCFSSKHSLINWKSLKTSEIMVVDIMISLSFIVGLLRKTLIFFNKNSNLPNNPLLIKVFAIWMLRGFFSSINYYSLLIKLMRAWMLWRIKFSESVCKIPVNKWSKI